MIATDILTALAGSSVITGEGFTAAALNSSPVTPGEVNSLLGNTPVPGNKPKAYINWILFDDQFQPVQTSSGFDAVDAADVLKSHSLLNIPMAKNGYLYVYCSNESDRDVFFDNLQLVHNRGPLLEETQYYPFGLTMSGISSKAAGGLENRFKYNGKELQHNEFSDGSGLEWEDYGARMYDGQIGRWMVLDQLADEYSTNSPYCYVLNNPIIHIDPDGKKVTVVRSQQVFATANTLPFYPKTIHDLGVTSIAGGLKGVTYSQNKDGKYDVGLTVVEQINPNLQRGWILDTKNPGLETEVSAHEHAHGDQFEEAFNAKITVNSGFSMKTKDGKQTAITLTGKIDDVLGQADAQYDKIKAENPSVLKGLSKADYIKAIFNSSLGEIIKKMPSDAETDANKRAAKKLGGTDKMPYTNGKYHISLN